jgi:hypothetical protein
MSTLDEITKEKRRIGEALARVDHSARSSLASSAIWRRLSGCLRVTAKARRQETLPQPRRRPRRRRRLLRRDQGARALGPKNQLAASAPRPPLAIRCSLWQMARRSRKSPLHARELARTMSAPPSPATNGLAASKSATESSTRRRRRCNAPRFDSGIKRPQARDSVVNRYSTAGRRPLPMNGRSDRTNTNGSTGRMQGLMMVRTPPRRARSNRVMSVASSAIAALAASGLPSGCGRERIGPKAAIAVVVAGCLPSAAPSGDSASPFGYSQFASTLKPPSGARR